MSDNDEQDGPPSEDAEEEEQVVGELDEQGEGELDEQVEEQEEEGADGEEEYADGNADGNQEGEEVGEMEHGEGDEDEEDEAMPVLEASNLTDEQRRQIRKKQRALMRDLEEKDGIDIAEARERNNEIFKSVRYTREAVLDGENLTVIAGKAAKEVERLVQVPRYDAGRLVNNLLQKCRSPPSQGSDGSIFDWKVLGIEAGVCFNSIPMGVSFLNGPLTDGQPLRVRQRIQRRREEIVEEEAKEDRPENVKGHTKRDADQLSAIESSMVVLQKTLKRKVDEQYRHNKKILAEKYGEDIPGPIKKKLKKHGVEICAIQYLFNPQSFTQTVENIFHYSFLVKKGAAAISVRDKPYSQEGLSGQAGPVVKYTDEKKTQQQQTRSRQTIVTLTMKDWRDLCRVYGVTKGDLPHRTGSKHTKRLSSSAASRTSIGSRGASLSQTSSLRLSTQNSSG